MGRHAPLDLPAGVEVGSVSRTFAAAAGGLVALCALVVAAIVLALGLRDGDTPPVELRPFALRSSLTPASHLFGDLVTAELALTFDRTAVDAASVTVSADFRPYLVVGRWLDERTDGRAVLRTWRWRLLCTDAPCLARGRSRRLRLPPADLAYRLADGERRRRAVEWPVVEAATRLSAGDRQAETLNGLFRVGLAPPEPTYRVGPGPAAWLLYGGAALLAAAALGLFAPELRRAFAAIPRPERDPLAGLPPLERALALVERAGANGGGGELRKALDRLARELRRTGEGDLARSARRLAWSSRDPSRPDVGELTGEVRKTIGGVR